MKSITLQSPAKVNLYLKITGRRSDGYHLLDTLFHRVSLADTLTLTKRVADFSFNSNAKLPPREGNLLFKAYVQLQKKFPNLPGVHARLVKRIPIGAGLGGGSSNAAFFLLGMTRLYQLKISKSELMKMGVQIGADVPFFLMNQTQASARGIGEKLKAVKNRKKNYFLFIPDLKPLATVEVYKKYTDTFQHPRGAPLRTPGVLLGLGENDLQTPAIFLRPSIAKSLNLLTKLGAKSVLMSGSGPTVFAVSHSQNEIKKLHKSLPKAIRKHSILCHSA